MKQTCPNIAMHRYYSHIFIFALNSDGERRRRKQDCEMYSSAQPADAEAVFKDLIPWWLPPITPPIYPSNCSASPLSSFLSLPSCIFFLKPCSMSSSSVSCPTRRHSIYPFLNFYPCVSSVPIMRPGEVGRKRKRKKKGGKRKTSIVWGIRHGLSDTQRLSRWAHGHLPTTQARKHTADTVHCANCRRDGLGPSFNSIHAY